MFSLFCITLCVVISSSIDASSVIKQIRSEINGTQRVIQLDAKTNRPNQIMTLWGLESRPELNGMTVIRNQNRAIFIQEETKSFRIPMHEFSSKESLIHKKTFSVKLSNIYMVTYSLLAECAQLLMKQMHDINVFPIITEPVWWSDSSLSYHLLTSFIEKAEGETEDLVMIILNTISRGSGVRHRALEKAFDGIGGYESVWAMADSEEYKSGDSNVLAMRILSEMSLEKMKQKQHIVHRLGRIAHDDVGGGQKGFDCLAEIAEHLSGNKEKMFCTVRCFDGIGEFIGIVE